MSDKPESLSRGAVLRVWREHAGLTQQRAVEALADLELHDLGEVRTRGKSTLANWELDKRSPSPDKVTRLARALALQLDQQQAMADMWRAVDSVAGLPARTYWEHNFGTKGDPAWIWLRCPSGGSSGSVTVGWGPFGENFTVPAGPAGLLLYSRASLPNPPVQVTFETSGWADFGHGAVPHGVVERLCLRAVEGASFFRGRFADPPELTEEEVSAVRFEIKSMGSAAHRLSAVWSRVRPQMGAMRPNSLVHPLQGARIVPWGGLGSLRTDGSGAIASQLLQSPEQIKDVRRVARGMSVEAVAKALNSDEVTDRSDGHITANQLETLERTGRVPEARHVIARLDHVYQLDGHLGLETVRDSRRVGDRRRGAFTIAFPGFWVGPVWLQLHAPAGRAEEETLDLYWGHWRRRQRVRDGVVLTTRKAVRDGPRLEVGLPPGWAVVAGTGLVPGAVDINHDWYPRTWTAAGRLVLEALGLLESAGRL